MSSHRIYGGAATSPTPADEVAVAGEAALGFVKATSAGGSSSDTGAERYMRKIHNISTTSMLLVGVGRESVQWDVSAEAWKRFAEGIRLAPTLNFNISLGVPIFLNSTEPRTISNETQDVVRSIFEVTRQQTGSTLVYVSDDRRHRYASAAALLDEWADENDDYDDRVWPLIEKDLRENPTSFGEWHE